MKKKKTSKIMTSRVLEILADEKSVDSTVKKVPGLSKDDVWAAVSEAAVFMKDESPDMDNSGIYVMNIDGSAMPNPGDAGIGIVIRDPEGKDVKKISRYIGHATNNIAEYIALIEGLKEARKLTGNLKVYSDSELMVKQLNGEYKVKNENLRDKLIAARELEKEFESVEYSHVMREYNSKADELANKAAKNRK